MPRKSLEARSTPRVDGRPDPIEPREGLSPEIDEIFRAIVAAVPVEHFRPADGHLVEQYSQAILLARRAYAELEQSGPIREDGKRSPWVDVLEKAHRSSVALAAKLRLAPQQRTDPKTTGREKGPSPNFPWGPRK
jgi:phage terminase small subunit